MAIPAAVLAGLGKVAANSAVQAGAEKLLRDVYGRIVSAPPAPPAASAVTLTEVAARLDATATRDDVAASFALLQAELDRRHRTTLIALSVVGAVQILLMLVLLLRS